jgi:mannobiose 2-epimerase
MAASISLLRDFDGQTWRSDLAVGLRAGLARNVIAPWFPRSIDRRDGGFLSGFDHRWRPYGRQDRMLEFQARQTRTAARLGMALPTDESWTGTVRHGLAYLDGVMRDATDGGWFALVDRGGQPLLGATKHAHGTAYLIACGAEAYRFTGNEQALAMARAAFGWLDTTLHDEEHGGYDGWATRDGKVIRSKVDLPPDLDGRNDDHLGHGIGLKDANVHSDLLEAFALLAAVSDDARVKQRLSEVFDVLTSAFCTAQGAVHYLVGPDLRPVPGIERYGYPLQTGFRLLAAGAQLGRPASEVMAMARRMLDHVLEWGWDERRGGFVEGGPATEPRAVGGTSLTIRKRPWWVQTEGTKLLLRMALDEPSPGVYHDHLMRLVRVIESDFVDARNGGWDMSARSDWTWRRRLPGRGLPKGDLWKDASHEADMHLAAIRMLRGLGPDEPID